MMHSACIQCGLSFEITDADLAFYDKVSPVIAGKKYSIPPSTHCPDCRQQRRLALRNPRKLWSCTCAQCGKGIQTTYSSERPEKVHCEAPRAYARGISFGTPAARYKCYLKGVY